ncbi:MAG: M12 family metallo-peptidase [Vicinamibacterales bacterium]
MRSWSWCRSTILALATAVAAAGPPLLAQDGPPLFIEASATAAPAGGADRGVVRRARRVRLDPAALAALLTDDAGRPAARLNLFADVQLALVRERLEADRLAHTTWVGHAERDAASLIALTWDGAYLSGAIVLDGVAYDVAGPAADIVIRERLPEPPSAELPPPEPPATRDASAQQDQIADGSTAAIDLLVLYTPAARARAGGAAAIQGQLANAVAVTNTALQRSGVNAVFTAVGLEELPYAEHPAGLGGDLSTLSPGGVLNGAIEAARSATGADLVALVTGRATTSGGCGVAWLGPSSSYAYNVTEQACLYAGQWSFSHELGHSFGARHAAGDSADTTPQCPTYACGYRDPAVRTLMAYFAVGGPPARILNYSSATVREPAGVGGPTGSAFQDNARRIGETAGLIAAFRSAVVPPSAPEPPRAVAATVTGATVHLTWLPPLGGGPVTAYELEAGSASGAADVVRAAVPGAPLPIAGVPPGIYYVRLRSLGPGGRSAPTPDVVVTVGGCVAPGPIALSASEAGGVVSLAWTPATGSGPIDYLVGAGRGPGAIDLGVFAMGGATSFAGAVPPGAYYVKVAASNACGLGPVSNEVLITVP